MIAGRFGNPGQRTLRASDGRRLQTGHLRQGRDRFLHGADLITNQG
jgi:hypothetical protein